MLTLIQGSELVILWSLPLFRIGPYSRPKLLVVIIIHLSLGITGSWKQNNKITKLQVIDTLFLLF
jgi:hypothetical protein